jgi:2-aminoethylphosphonate dioxygenase
MLNIALDDARKATWKENHFLVYRGALDSAGVHRLRTWVDELSQWPETPGKWMKYFESGNEHDRQLCRVENFVPYHDALNELVRGRETMSILDQLMDESAVLFKEKVNLKLPGGAGFSAHQDAPAFATFGHRYHITMLIAVDDATTENGCLEMSDPVAVYEYLDQEADGTISRSLEAEMPWRALELSAGDVVFFDSYIPHRSMANQSDGSRRALYLTYNRLAEGDVRDAYFVAKRGSFPPECERAPGVDYEGQPSPYNLGNPIR